MNIWSSFAYHLNYLFLFLDGMDFEYSSLELILFKGWIGQARRPKTHTIFLTYISILFLLRVISVQGKTQIGVHIFLPADKIWRESIKMSGYLGDLSDKQQEKLSKVSTFYLDCTNCIPCTRTFMNMYSFKQNLFVYEGGFTGLKSSQAMMQWSNLTKRGLFINIASPAVHTLLHRCWSIWITVVHKLSSWS